MRLGVTRSQLAVVVIVVGSLAALFVVLNVHAQTVPTALSSADPGPYVRVYDPPTNRLEVVLNQGDGQAFAALAQDPTLSRPDQFRGGEAEAAYRAQRPLLGWIAWASSFGNATLVPVAMLVWTVLGAVLLAVAAAMAAPRDRVRLVVVAVLAMPGTLITLDWTGPEVLGTGAAVLAVALWQRRRPPLIMVGVWLVVAGLSRETLLLVPLVLLICDVSAGRSGARRIVTLISGPAVYGMWVLVVHARLGAWPTDAHQGRVAFPFVGLVQAVPAWGWIDLGCALLGVALTLGAIIVVRSDASIIAIAYLAFAACMGEAVWMRMEDFGRVLLPMYVFSVVAILERPVSASEANMCSQVALGQ